MKPTPYICPVCNKQPQEYYGRIVFEGEEYPTCPNSHRNEAGEVVLVALVPVQVKVAA